MSIVLIVFLIVLLFLLWFFNSRNKIPKVIWTYWHEQELPDFIQKCVDTWYSNNKDYTINVLNDQNIYEFLTREEIENIHSWKWNNSHQKMSDLIRLHILSKYGGIWLDASIVCYESFDWVQEENAECILYTIPELSKTPLIESWFIACNPNNKFVNKWKNEFMYTAEFDSIDEYVKASEVDMTAIKYPDYLLVYVCARKVHSEESSSVKLLNASEGPYVYHTKGGIRSIKEYKFKKPKFFKFRKEDRASIDKELEYYIFNPPTSWK